MRDGTSALIIDGQVTTVGKAQTAINWFSRATEGAKVNTEKQKESNQNVNHQIVRKLRELKEKGDLEAFLANHPGQYDNELNLL